MADWHPDGWRVIRGPDYVRIDVRREDGRYRGVDFAGVDVEPGTAEQAKHVMLNNFKFPEEFARVESAFAEAFGG